MWSVWTEKLKRDRLAVLSGCIFQLRLFLYRQDGNLFLDALVSLLVNLIMSVKEEYIFASKIRNSREMFFDNYDF